MSVTSKNNPRPRRDGRSFGLIASAAGTVLIGSSFLGFGAMQADAASSTTFLCVANQSQANFGQVFVRTSCLPEERKVNLRSMGPSGNVASDVPVTLFESLGLADTEVPSAATGPTGPANFELTGSNYLTSIILTSGDAARIVKMNSSTAVDLTIPLDGFNAYTFPIGTQVVFTQLGVGQVVVRGQAGVTIRSEGTRLTTKARYAVGSLIKLAANEWLLSGNLTV